MQVKTISVKYKENAYISIILHVNYITCKNKLFNRTIEITEPKVIANSHSKPPMR